MTAAPRKGASERMIYTVFFTDEESAEMPHDCESYAEAVAYAEEKGGNSVIESTTGNVE